MVSGIVCLASSWVRLGGRALHGGVPGLLRVLVADPGFGVVLGSGSWGRRRTGCRWSSGWLQFLVQCVLVAAGAGGAGGMCVTQLARVAFAAAVVVAGVGEGVFQRGPVELP